MKLIKLKILSGSMLKLIAVISMLIDHAALIFKNEFEFFKTTPLAFCGIIHSVYYMMRCLGRLAFPIFCFLIVEGVLHTKDVKKYTLRLAVFALISEIPFNLMLGGNIFYPLKQNVYFTLVLGVLAILLFEKMPNHFLKFCALGTAMATAFLLRTDYGFAGVVLIVMLYVLRNSPSTQALVSYFILPSSAKMFAFSAFIPINMYNGKRGFIKSRALKLGFYIFYPLHILLLVAIKYIISGT